MNGIILEIAKITGPVGVAIIALIIIVKAFLKYLEKRDADQTTLITNHFKHNTEAMNKLENSIIKMTIVFETMHNWLKRNGK